MIGGAQLPEGARFHEAIADGWAAGYAKKTFHRRRTHFARILDRNVRPGTNWVDLGCGAGVLTVDLLARGAGVVAIDGSQAMLDAARDLVGADPRVSWFHGDVHRLGNVADESADGVLCSSVLEYAVRPHEVLAEVWRVLRPSGRFIVSVPPSAAVVRSLQKVARRLGEWTGRDSFRYLSVSRFEVSPSHVPTWLAEAGFHLTRSTKFDPFLPALSLYVLRPALLLLEAEKDVVR